jgi:predicted aspartyl protease
VMWRLLGILLLVVAYSPEAAGPCRLQPVADLPATLTRNGIEVTAQVNRVNTQLVLDTGAELTLLTAATVNSLLLARSQLTVSQLIGVGGGVSNADVYADLQLGTADFQRRFVVADIPGMSGLIGGDVLNHYDVEIDLSSRRVRLWKASTCTANDLPSSGPRATVPVHVTWGNRLIATVTLNGKQVDALLDSGSAITLLQIEAAREVGVTTTMTADSEVPVHGIAGSTIMERLHRFESMRIGNDQIDGPEIGIGDSQLISPAMIIGRDYLRSRRIWLSYRTGQAFVQ